MYFYKKFIELDYIPETCMPILKFKFRDKLQFSGKKVDYSDFSRFYLKDKKYTPVFLVENTDDGKIIEGYPLITIGALECALSFGLIHDINLLALIRISVSRFDKIYTDCFCVLKDYDVYKKTLNGWEYFVSSALRMTRHTHFDTEIKELTTILNYLAVINPRVYAEIILDIMRMVYPVVSGCWLDSDELGTVTLEGDERSAESLKGCFQIDYKRIGYSVDNKKYYITDGTGAGVAAFLILMSSCFAKYADWGSRACVDNGLTKEIYRDRFQKFLNNSLGDDIEGTYYSKGFITDNIFSSSDDIRDYGLMFAQRGRFTNKDGKSVNRTVYEQELLFKRTYKLQFRRTNYSQDRPFDPNYVNPKLRGRILSSFIDSLGNDSWESSIEKLKEDVFNDVREKYNNVVQGSKYNKVLADLESSRSEVFRLEKSAKDLTQERDALQAKVRELQRILDSKSSIIDKLTIEVKELNREVDSIYTDVTIEDFIEDGISYDDMVEFLKDYKLVMLGGRSSLNSKLSDLGLNVISVNKETDLNGTQSDGDFFCCNTSFIGHKIVFAAKRKYKNQADCFYYYNGTNVENLIRASYDFVSKWMNK